MKRRFEKATADFKMAERELCAHLSEKGLHG